MNLGGSTSIHLARDFQAQPSSRPLRVDLQRPVMSTFGDALNSVINFVAER